MTISEFLSEPDSADMSGGQAELLNCWDGLSCEQRKTVLALLKSIAK